MDGHHFDHITKSYKETLVLAPYQMVHMGVIKENYGSIKSGF
jgi:hypothetical protein